MEKVILKRQSKYELIRLMGCLAITLSHLPCSDDPLVMNSFIHVFYVVLGGFGVNVFVVLGAWFLCRSDFKFGRILRIICQMLFYGLFLDILSLIFGQSFDIKTMASGFMYWFPFGYTIMLLVATLVNKMNSKTKTIIIIIGGAIASAVTVLGFFNLDSFIVKLFSKGLFIGPLWFVYVLIFTGQLRSFLEQHHSIQKTKVFGLFLLTFLSMYTIMLLFDVHTIRDTYSPLALISAALLFIFIHLTDIPQKKIINMVAGASFGIYLLQTHRVFRPYIWTIFDFEELSRNSVWYVGFCIVEVVFIFLIGFVIDKVWDQVNERISKLKLYKKTCNKIDLIVNRG